MNKNALLGANKPVSLLLLALGITSSALAQMMPVVDIHASDPRASWSGDPGVFTVFRQGPTNATLNIFYRVGGTAVNGEDYKLIGNWVTILAGERTNAIKIQPIDLGQTTTKTVKLELAPSPMMPPVNYLIGRESNAVVFISATADTNYPPSVRIASPPDGAIFPALADLPICAGAADPDGWVSTVEFFANGRSLGVTTNNPMSVGPMNPFCLVWSNAPAGTYTLTAEATDNGGASTLSPPIKVMVAERPPPPTNYPPTVRITSPPNGAVFPSPANIPIFAYARDPDDAVMSVEFFDGRTSLGFGSNLCCVAPSTDPRCPTNVFTLIWSNAPLGEHTLIAKATDAVGLAGVSGPVNIAVVRPPPPPTNPPIPVVSIAAIDPIAIEGTNCWPWLGLTNRYPAWSNWVGSISSCRWFTNCGPKNATFAVRRLGNTNEDLTVTYGIGGSATNGVDYVPLPGIVTIPAGERRALVTLIPIDDGLPGPNSTVILTLMPGTNYCLGFPRRAAALIVDSMRPFPGTSMLTDRTFYLNASGPDGAWYRVEYSTDMVNWTAVCINQVVNGSIDFVDPDANNDQSRFYRAMPEDNPPLQ
jgi:hypothetical protein